MSQERSRFRFMEWSDLRRGVLSLVAIYNDRRQTW